MGFPLLGKKLLEKDYCRIDLSEKNPRLDYRKTSDPQYLDQFIQGELKDKQVLLGIGGYLEKRNIYQASANFAAERNIHLAIDVWAEVGTGIHAPLNSKVHSFKYNDLPYDYGSTIVLEHRANEGVFHTLYGHLSKASLEGLEIGMDIPGGTRFCTIGDWNENGGWPPHLHFQIIRDMQGFKGDYIGVCREEKLDFYKTNCPDPTYLIGWEN